MRRLIVIWLVLQALILLFIATTHGRGMEPDLRMLSGAAIALCSFPLSVPAMFAALSMLEPQGLNGTLPGSLLLWAAGAIAGALELWLIVQLVRRFLPRP